MAPFHRHRSTDTVPPFHRSGIWIPDQRDGIPSYRGDPDRLTRCVLTAGAGILLLREELTWRIVPASLAIPGGVAPALTGKVGTGAGDEIACGATDLLRPSLAS